MISFSRMPAIETHQRKSPDPHLHVFAVISLLSRNVCKMFAKAGIQLCCLAFPRGQNREYHAQNGGEGGIRTHGDANATTVFETAAFDHSATSPYIKKCKETSVKCKAIGKIHSTLGT